MRRILGWGALRRGRRGKSLIILFKSMRLHQCARAIFRLLLSSDLWPFAFSINTSARMTEDAIFHGFVPVQPTPLRRIRAKKMNTAEVVFVLAMLFCVVAGLDCNKSVGMEHRNLPDHLITSSSHFKGHMAHHGRLNNVIKTPKWGAWCAKDSNVNQYLQVDLEKVRNLTGVATQGYMYNGRVSSYRIMYSVNGKQWFSYKENGTTKTFKGNFDKSTVIYHGFNHKLAARFIRFNPRTWGQMICMRVDIYACELPKLKTSTTVPPTTKEQTIYTEQQTVLTNEVRVTQDDVKTETTRKVVEEFTMTVDTALENERNAAGSHFSSWQSLLLCVLLVCYKLFN